MFRNKLKNPQTLLLTGMAALLVANILHIALRWAGDAENLVMGAMGLFYGISFGLLLLSARLKARRRAGLGDPC